MIWIISSSRAIRGRKFQKKKNYITKKEFVYRMCLRWPTSAMPKPFLCCERAFCCSMMVIWSVLMHVILFDVVVMSFDVMKLLVLYHVTWCNAMWCALIWFDATWLLVLCHVTWCNATLLDVHSCDKQSRSHCVFEMIL